MPISIINNTRITTIKRSLGILFLLAFSGNLLTAQNLQISGGFSWSVSLCSNGKIYAWGNNGRGQLGRNPGTGVKYAAATSTVPLEVQLPAGITMRNVDAGSGGTGIALACDGSVWTWGENCSGAIGNGLIGTCGASPTDGNGYYSAMQRVVGGEQGGAWLTNIGYINAATGASFAVEAGTGKVLAWGDNQYGQLGQGTADNTGNTYAPRYVKTASGVDLTNIVMVEGTDYGGYALSADGYVYSWGRYNNQDIGRVPAGDEYYAQRVKAYNYTTGTTTDDLSNIVKMSGGDTHGLAIDSDGNLWSWGGDWGPGQRGWGATGTAVPYATRVVAPGTTCDYEQWKFGPWLTDVIEISAGQQHSIALLADGRVVTFGNDGGGQLGDGGTGGSSGCPVYAKTDATTDLTGIVAVSDGDLWSFAINNAGVVYVWGENGDGQLGISGSTTDLGYATANPAIPTTCGGSLLPCPVADLGVDVLKCPGTVERLFAGSYGDPYRYTWYYGPSDTGPWTQIGAANQTYAANGHYIDVTDAQFYRVQITDIRNPVSTACGPCPASIDVIEVEDRTPPLSTSDAGTCSGNACFEINSTGAIDNNAFDWYATQVTPTKLNTLGTTNPFCTAQTNLTLSGGNYEIWVEDMRDFQSTVGPTTPPCTPAPTGTENGVNANNYQQQFIVYRDITLTSVQVYYRTYNTSATPDQVRVTVYSNDPNKNSSGKDGVDAATGAVSATVNVPRTSTNFQLFTLSGLNLPLTGTAAGSKYWLELTSVGGSNGTFGDLKCTANYPYTDAVAGEDVVTLNGSTASKQAIQQANYNASTFNWNFTYQSGYPCGRFKLTAPAATTACLPVEFLYFRGENRGSSNLLTWATGWEQSSGHFLIQRSYDGENWTSIGMVSAAGHSENALKYSYTDNVTRAGLAYYRIEEVGTDGSSTLSKMIVLNATASVQLTIRPNPSDGQFAIEAAGMSGFTTIHIYDAVGKLVYQSSENTTEGFLKELDLSYLGKGIYLVTLSNERNSSAQKLIIE